MKLNRQEVKIDLVNNVFMQLEGFGESWCAFTLKVIIGC